MNRRVRNRTHGGVGAWGRDPPGYPILLGACQRPEGFLVLTPFRAQRMIIRDKLRAAGLRSVKVATVHAAQGSECDVVIFDPVDGGSSWLQNEENKKLMNVAFSRARDVLMLMLSDDDKRNPVLMQAANFSMVRVEEKKGAAIPLPRLKKQDDYPLCLVRKLIRIPSSRGDVVGIVDRLIEGDQKFVLIDAKSGAERIYRI